MESVDNQLNVNIDGVKVKINVLDIIKSNVYGKTFILYTVNDENETVFASILNEKEDSYSLDPIVEKDEIDYINLEINRVAEELREEE